MALITSTDIANAIAFSKSDPEVSVLLRKRDDNVGLVCAFIKCTLLSRIEEPVKTFEVVFNYDSIKEPLPGEDVVVVVEVTNGRAAVMEVRTP